MKSGKTTLSVGRKLSLLSWWWALLGDTAVSKMMSLGSPNLMKPKVPENLLRARRLCELHGSSRAWSVLELVSLVVVTENLEFACRTRASVLAPGCCHLEEQAWDGTVQTLSSNCLHASGETCNGATDLTLPLPFGGAWRSMPACPRR